MTKVLERVRQLINLAARSSSEDQEGRTAALQACRLIEKHGLLFVGESAAEPAAMPVQEPEAPPRSPRPSARVRVPMRAVNGVETMGKVIHDVAVEAASRITVKDVVDVFVKRRR